MDSISIYFKKYQMNPSSVFTVTNKMGIVAQYRNTTIAPPIITTSSSLFASLESNSTDEGASGNALVADYISCMRNSQLFY